MPYSIREFLEDASAMPEVNSTEWDLPESQWPRLHLRDTGETIVLPMNNPMSRMMTYFLKKYGRERGTDNAMRYDLLASFFAKNRDRLIKEGLVVTNPDGTVVIRTDFIEFLLNGFQEPNPPVVIGKHVDTKKFGDLPYRKIIRRWHHSEKQGSSKSGDQ